MQDLRVSYIQTNLFWENRHKNLEHFSVLIGEADPQTDILVLPEMFSTGFTMNAVEVAETMQGDAVSWMKEKAVQHNMVLVGSLVIEEKGKYYNRLIWMRPDGSFETYDKRHLFRMADEQDHYTSGDKRLIVACKGWRICPLVCYDLRFPVWSRNRKSGTDKPDFAYDLLLYVANWPERRRIAWQTLLRARAIENLSYVVGVNRVGRDGKEIDHSGDSAVIDYKGTYVDEALPGEEKIASVLLSHTELQEFRTSFPANLDSDDFQLL